MAAVHRLWKKITLEQSNFIMNKNLRKLIEKNRRCLCHQAILIISKKILFNYIIKILIHLVHIINCNKYIECLMVCKWHKRMDDPQPIWAKVEEAVGLAKSVFIFNSHLFCIILITILIQGQKLPECTKT